jgi:hypothetical protein
MNDYHKWFKLSSTQKMEHTYPVKDEGKMIRTYEPFVIQSKVTSEGPSIRYNEAFVARYYKKASYIASLRLTGYRLEVATKHFLIHRDHPLSEWANDDRVGMALREKMEQQSMCTSPNFKRRDPTSNLKFDFVNTFHSTKRFVFRKRNQFEVKLNYCW